MSSTRHLDTAERDPFARILAALGMEETSIWADVAAQVEELADREADEAARARVAEREADRLRNELDTLRAAVESARVGGLEEAAALVEEYGQALERTAGSSEPRKLADFLANRIRTLASGEPHPEVQEMSRRAAVRDASAALGRGEPR